MDCREDHPRSRGVYEDGAADYDGVTGSSPLARGLLNGKPFIIADLGIIPARAGFTRQKTITAAQDKDHPRSRGVYPRHARLKLLRNGSSPLARGLPLRLSLTVMALRIIPARAGFTSESADVGSVAEDHPRSRGVYDSRRMTTPTRFGSSPLARGLRPGLRLRAIARRIIPARAGFTSKQLRPDYARQDHPRSRGVYPLSLCSVTAHQGSSPLARGLHKHMADNEANERIIPARAGFT